MKIKLLAFQGLIMNKTFTFWIKFLCYLIGYFCYPFSFLIPRSQKIWIFGSLKGSFNQNSKYLFIHVSEQVPNICAIWISYKTSVVKEIRSKGLKAYSLFSFQGIYYALRGKYYFFNSYSSDICYFTSGGAIMVNLWHGVGLKKIEFSIKTGPLANRYLHKTLKERYFYPFVYKRPDFMLSSTDFQSVKFAEAFRIPNNKCLNMGYPRNDILVWDLEKIEDFIDKYEPIETRSLITLLKKYKKVYLYMPTWRDSQRKLFSIHLELEQLNTLMKDTDALFLLKPHPNVKVCPDILKQYSSLMLLNPLIDIYTVLPYTHVLITDYSSILYDYLLMKDKDIILYLYDYDQYVKERDFNYPFLENVAGTIVYNFAQLLLTIKEKQFDRSKHTAINQLFWGNYKGNASAEIIAYLTEEYLLQHHLQ